MGNDSRFVGAQVPDAATRGADRACIRNHRPGEGLDHADNDEADVLVAWGATEWVGWMT